MPWHCSRSDPRKVYDSRHEAVCVAQNAEQATLIVRAVNAMPREDADTFVKLREPNPAGKESAESDQSGASLGAGKPEVALTHVIGEAEGCCRKHLQKASLSGALDRMQPFECPKCQTTYWPKREGPLASWTARADVLVFKT